LQYYGDGTLAIFNSAIEAVECATRIQLALQKKPKIPLRIGLHTGDILYDGEGVYGDGVNVASWIEGLAVPTDRPDEMFHFLKRSIQAKENFVIFIRGFQTLSKYQSDPRYTALVKMMWIDD
jgi:hypothetical protein